MLPLAPKVLDIFDNAKFEQVACAGLQPKYNGSPDELIPTLNAIHFQHQNKVWYAATFLIQNGQFIDLLCHLSRITQDTIKNKAKELWDNQDSLTLRHTRGTEMYNSRLLAVFLINSKIFWHYYIAILTPSTVQTVLHCYLQCVLIYITTI